MYESWDKKNVSKFFCNLSKQLHVKKTSKKKVEKMFQLKKFCKIKDVKFNLWKLKTNLKWMKKIFENVQRIESKNFIIFPFENSFHLLLLLIVSLSRYKFPLLFFHLGYWKNGVDVWKILSAVASTTIDFLLSSRTENYI